MNDKIEKKLKELLPYIIIEGIIFLLMPLFMGTKEGVATYLIEIGAFPLTAFGCCFFYAFKKKKHDLFICAIGPVFYALSALLYGMWRDSWFTVLIYLAAYFLCGYLGLMLSDVLGRGKSSKKPVRPQIKRPSVTPKRVNVEQHEDVPAAEFKAEDPAEDDSLDVSTTEDDIAAILNDIHNRKSQ